MGHEEEAHSYVPLEGSCGFHPAWEQNMDVRFHVTFVMMPPAVSPTTWLSTVGRRASAKVFLQIYLGRPGFFERFPSTGCLAETCRRSPVFHLSGATRYRQNCCGPNCRSNHKRIAGNARAEPRITKPHERSPVLFSISLEPYPIGSRCLATARTGPCARLSPWVVPGRPRPDARLTEVFLSHSAFGGVPGAEL